MKPAAFRQLKSKDLESDAVKQDILNALMKLERIRKAIPDLSDDNKKRLLFRAPGISYQKLINDIENILKDEHTETRNKTATV